MRMQRLFIKITKDTFLKQAMPLKEILKSSSCLGDNPFYITLSGSSGMGVASRLNLPFEQEVLSCTSAINLLAKDTETAIELGGEDAKITYLKGSLEQRMNGACAGGTGAFIDQMANLLNTDAKGLNDLAKKAPNSILLLLVVVSLLKLTFRHSSMMVLKRGSCTLNFPGCRQSDCGYSSTGTCH